MATFLKSSGLALLCVALFLLGACRGQNSDNAGTFSLRVRYAQDFDANVQAGNVVSYRVTITGGGLVEPVVKTFPAGTASATFDGFADASVLSVVVEYVNGNGQIVRRGRAPQVVIVGGEDTPAEMTVNNVPVFSNVADDAVVVSQRFVPRVFAPGGISFQIQDESDSVAAILPDVVSGEATFSVSAATESATLPVHIAALAAGSHVLSVFDPATGESSSVRIYVLERDANRALTTTAGASLGSLLGEGVARTFNLEAVHRKVTR